MSILEQLKNLFVNSPQGESNNINRNYSFETIEDIENIKIPTYSKNSEISSPVNNIEYILHRKATEFKKAGKEDLALACLRKANEIFPHSNYTWSKKDYMRIVEFLKYFGRFDEARAEEKYIIENYDKYFSENSLQQNGNNENAIDIFINQNKDYYCSDDNDLVSTELTSRACTCEICSRYRGRIFSVYGKDKRFPKLPDELRKMYIHRECSLRFSPYIFYKGDRNYFSPIYDPSISLEKSDDIIKYVNRPFIDDRTSEEKEYYEQEKRKKQIELQDRKDYDWIREHLPEQAPKSFGGYRKMKNLNSSNYNKLKTLASQKGYFIS